MTMGEIPGIASSASYREGSHPQELACEVLLRGLTNTFEITKTVPFSPRPLFNDYPAKWYQAQCPHLH